MKPYYEHAGITIYHGDCREILPEIDVDAFVSDPPYGIGLENHAVGKERRSESYEIAGDVNSFIGEWLSEWARLSEKPTILFASPWNPWPGEWRNLLVWDKGPAVGGGGDTATCFKRTWELIQSSRTPALQVPRGESILRYWIGPQDSELHVAQKPIGLMIYLLAALTLKEQLICDPCAGSGTTLEAAKLLHRRAIGIEIEEKYCEIAAKRLSQEVFDFSEAKS
jgi:DNA modification methylase